ncbi:solute carrier organic anion transporter family member 6A1 [Saccopteryx leptura]|uniref:solute carrier organic anion transporter family member 6A1 n=1 Tax=Saccopteryx leptura TaxID=249018 RepID=UPI00339C8921
MREARVVGEPQATQAQTAEDQPPQSKILADRTLARRKSQYVKALTAVLMNLHRTQKKRKHKTEVTPPVTTKKAEKQNQSLEKPCGLGCIVIPYCQRFNDIRCFQTLFCTLQLAQGIVFGLVDMSIDTFTKNNHVKTFASIILSTSYDISSCLIVLFISYYGVRGNIIRWITFSCFLIGFGSLLFAFPNYSGEKYQMKTESEDICKETKIPRSCKTPISFQSKYISFFILGQTVQGIAGIPLYILGITFLDDSVSRYSTGTYLGLAEASVTAGYAFGYAIAAPLVMTAENSTIDESIGHSDDNEHWLHTWWIRYVFVSIIAWSTLIPLSCFPQRIRGTAKIKAAERKKPNWLDKKFKDREFGTSIKDFFASIWILLKMPMLVCLALTRASESLLLVGASEFLPKYTENLFVLTPAVAVTITGLVLIPGAALSQLLGGIIVSKLRMDCKGFMRFIIVTSAMSLVLLVFSLLVRCEPEPFAGISENYSGTSQLGNLTAPCNSHCKCSTEFYSLVCGRNDVRYFSPCFAGCTYSKTLNNQKTYFNCSCINEGLTTSDDQGDFIDARPGTCGSKCYQLPLFVVFIFSTILFAGFSGIPNMLTILRVVPNKLRSLALGLTYVILRVFGSIPGPIIFRAAGETSCTFRVKGRCGHTGNCWMYNTKQMAFLFLGLCVSCKLFTIIFSSIAFCLYIHSPKTSTVWPIPLKNVEVKKKRKKKRTDL